MGTAIKALTLVQIGEESTRGTAVAATRKLMAKDATWRHTEDFEEFTDQMHGTLARVAQAPIKTFDGSEFDIVMALDFEQILLALLAGFKGAVTPTTPGSGDARLWTFTPSVTADPAIDTYTLEFASKDGASNELSFESPYTFCTGFSISAGEDGLPELTMNFVGRAPSETATTGALTKPAITHAANIQWKVYLDTTWAGLGGTQITGQVKSFTFTFGDFVRAERYHDGRVTLDFSNYEFNAGRLGDITMEVVIDPNSGFVPDEDAPKSAGTLRFVRLELLGAAFDSPDDGLNRHVIIDGAYYHAPDSMGERGSDADGLATTTVHLMSAYDPTQAQDLEITIQNILATFP